MSTPLVKVCGLTSEEQALQVARREWDGKTQPPPTQAIYGTNSGNVGYTPPGSGTAQSILNKFFEYCPRDVFLSVRADNLTANNFYVKMDMKLIGKTSWAKGTLPGNVYVKRKTSSTGLEE